MTALTKPKFLTSRRAFQVLLVASNLVPLFTGTLVAINGVELFVSTEHAGPEFAAQVRVYAIWFTGMFFLCLWVARNIDIGGPVLAIAATLMTLAGASRFYTMIDLDAVSDLDRNRGCRGDCGLPFYPVAPLPCEACRCLGSGTSLAIAWSQEPVQA